MSKHIIKFVADESLEYSIVLYLRRLDYDVVSIAEDCPSIKDEDILSSAYSEERIILTNDKDFGDLVFLNKLLHKGVILFRLKSELVKEKIRVLDSLLKNYEDRLFGNFVVVDEEKVRIRS